MKFISYFALTVAAGVLVLFISAGFTAQHGPRTDRGTKALFDEVQAVSIPTEQECLDAYRTGAHLPGCVYVMRGDKVTVTIFPPR